MSARREGAPEALPVTYGAIGATQAVDLLYYPPQGFRPVERSVKLGSGAERFSSAKVSLFSWGIQRGAGLEVLDIDPGTGEQYAGVDYDENGVPLSLRRTSEIVYGEDGEPLISNGMSAVLRTRVGPFNVNAPVRVVYTIDEPRRAGFAYGTLTGHPASGEEAFILERRDDDSIWLTIRAFSRPSSFWFALVSPVSRIVLKQTMSRFLRALHPAGQA